MEPVMQFDKELNQILKKLFDDPPCCPGVRRQLQKRIQYVKDPPKIRPVKRPEVAVLNEDCFGADDIMVSVECKALNKSNDLYLARAVQKETGVWYPPIDRDKVKPLVHRHDFFEMFYVYRGGCVSTIQQQDIAFFAGDICLYNLNAVHSMYVPHDEDVVFNILIRKRLITETFLGLIDHSDLFFHFFIDSLSHPDTVSHLVVQQIQKSAIEVYIKKLILTYFNSNHQNYLKALLSCLLNEIGEIFKENMVQSSFHADNHFTILQVIQLIEQHCATITLEELASYFHYTPRNMIYYIKKYTNKTFSDLLRQCKIRCACDLLCSSSQSPEQIAEQVGYNDRSYLDRLFKQYLGVSMAKYRKSMQKSHGL